MSDVLAERIEAGWGPGNIGAPPRAVIPYELEAADAVLREHAELCWLCGFGSVFVEWPDDDVTCSGCNGRQDLRDCGPRLLVDPAWLAGGDQR